MFAHRKYGLEGPQGKDAFRQLSHETEGFNPMQKVLLEEYMDLAVVVELDVAPLEMVNSVATCILDIRWNEVLHYTVPDHLYKGSRQLKIAHIPL